MRVLTANKCPFGMRGGGHMVFAGSSSADHEVTIDLGYMNHSTYDPETKLASLRPGGTWAEVYGTLGPHGVTATGARSNLAGVGGFLLGGGNSLHSTAYGWAYQNVENFEVVLGNGSVVNADRDRNRDLWLGLRGGGLANFGLTHNMSDAVVEATVKFADTIEDHVDCSGVYDDFLEPKTVLDRTTLGNGVDGLQDVWVTGSYNHDIRILRYGLKRFKELDDESVGALLQYHQPLTEPMIRNGDGPSILGLDYCFAKAGNSTGMLSILLLQVAKPALLAALERIGHAFQRDMGEHATALGINWGWKYLNYADYSEDPIAS
ncbi:hypothetical protein PG994_003500 [Apiospora phragmitis]|uniref:FAD-binding PCMH-type domain-containing protein n=1 Tax=Apiospora phragmitis TaxID=2905665 RepID=A0ABR1VYC6_9PEZI